MYSDTEYLNKLEIVQKLVGNYETIGDASIDPDRVKKFRRVMHANQRTGRNNCR